jgi:NAD(P)-dependent dehydrogenase (short-subunit alcohol dehydrogenase family)
MDFTRSSAIVCGGAGGLGGATSRRLVELGVGVVIFEPASDRAASFAEELGDRAVFVAGDQNDDEDVARAIAAAQKLGVFSINVNSAGVLIRTPATADQDGKAHDMSLFREMIEMHLFGPFNMSRLCAAAFAENKPDEDGQRGVIVNTGSVAGFEGQPKQVAYSAAKGGVAAMTLSMARDLADIGVRVCSIAPGPFETARTRSAPPHLRVALVNAMAFPKRLGEPAEFASLVEGILRTPFLNGQTIRLDGAMTAGRTDLPSTSDNSKSG